MVAESSRFADMASHTARPPKTEQRARQALFGFALYCVLASAERGNPPKKQSPSAPLLHHVTGKGMMDHCNNAKAQMVGTTMSTTGTNSDETKKSRGTFNLADAIAHETATTMISELAKSASRNGTESRTKMASGEAVLPNAIFSSIGLGIVNDFPVESDDATEAALKAVQDAIERGGLGLTILQNLVLSVRVGVPGRPKQPSLPMHVDVAHLTPLVPPTVALGRLEVVIGGLMAPVSSKEANRGGICSAVACLSFFHQGSQGAKESAKKTPFSVRSHISGGEEEEPSQSWHFSGGNGAAVGAQEECRGSAKTNYSAIGPASHDSGSRQQGALQPVHSHANPKTFVRANSMELLARISSEIRDQQPEDSEEARLAAAHNYKKLPPGKTPKNNKRLFVRHQYHDFSRDTPSPGEEYLVRPDAPLRTPNAAFPLKLHETLTIIEKDGLGHVIGWMPHGRSFKIHKHQEFVDDILPKYFV